MRKARLVDKVIACLSTPVLAGLFSVHVLAQQMPTAITTSFVSGATADITALKRTDEGITITLNGVYNNKTNRAIFLDVSDIKLIDFKNRKEYLVIRDDQNQCICSTNAGTFQVAEGTSVGFWAKFAAPPEAVTALSLVWTTAEPVMIPITK